MREGRRRVVAVVLGGLVGGAALATPSGAGGWRVGLDTLDPRVTEGTDLSLLLAPASAAAELEAPTRREPRLPVVVEWRPGPLPHGGGRVRGAVHLWVAPGHAVHGRGSPITPLRITPVPMKGVVWSDPLLPPPDRVGEGAQDFTFHEGWVRIPVEGRLVGTPVGRPAVRVDLTVTGDSLTYMPTRFELDAPWGGRRASMRGQGRDPRIDGP